MNEVARQVINIEPDFAAIWGNLDSEAYANLKAEIKADGIRDPLVIWNKDNKHILIDGHNRLRVAEELKIPAIPICYKVFADKSEAALWILNHQSARRNITDGQKYLAAETVQRILKAKAKEQQGARTDILENSPKSEPIDTRKEVSKASGLTEWKVRQGDYVREHAPEKLEEIRTGKTTLKEAYKDTVRKNAPSKADRMKEAVEAYESTKQEGKTVDIQTAVAHKQAEANLNFELAHETYRAIYDICSAAQKLTDENIKIYKAYYSQKDNAKMLTDARTVWNAGRKLTDIGLWIKEVKNQ